MIASHIFSENFIEIPQVFQKKWRFSLWILTFCIRFRFFYISLLQRSWQRMWAFPYSQPTIKRLFNNYINLYSYKITSYQNMLKYKVKRWVGKKSGGAGGRGGSCQINPVQKKLLSESLSLLSALLGLIRLLKFHVLELWISLLVSVKRKASAVNFQKNWNVSVFSFFEFN